MELRIGLWCVGAAATLTLAGSALATAAKQESDSRSLGSGQISFYSNVGNPIGQNNPPLVRPSTLVMFVNGSWLIVDLKWSGWGSSVARATGVSSSSNCTPSCANGARRESPAQLTLSHPEVLLGRKVYGCFQLTIPATPTANQHACIKRTGSLYGYSSVAKPSPVAAPTAKTDVRFSTPSRNIACEMFDDGTSQSDVSCGMQEPEAITHLSADGRVAICQHRPKGRCTGNFGEGPAFHQLAYGSSVTSGRFRCSSSITGVTCTVIATGKGLFISRQAIKPVG